MTTSQNTDPDWLDAHHNHILTSDEDAQKVLLHFGMVGSIPNPAHANDGKCGYAMYSDITPSFFMVMFRACNCEKEKDATYAILFISKKLHTVKEAWDIREAWLQFLYDGEKVDIKELEFPCQDRN